MAIQTGIKAGVSIAAPATGGAAPAVAGVPMTEVEREGAQAMMAKGGAAKTVAAGEAAKGGAAKAAVAEVEREAAAAKMAGTKVSTTKIAAGGAGKVAVAGKAAVVKGVGPATVAAGTQGKAAVGMAAVGATGTSMATTATVSPIAAATSGSSILASKGVCLGLGLGLGAWGPVLVGVAALAGAVSLYGYLQKRRSAGASDDDGVSEVLA